MNEPTKFRQLMVVLIDSMAPGLIGNLLSLVPWAFGFGSYAHSNFFGWMQILIIVAYWIIAPLFLMSATPAMAISGLTVVSRKDEPLRRSFALFRSLFIFPILFLALPTLIMAIIFGFRTPFDVIFRCRMAYKRI